MHTIAPDHASHVNPWVFGCRVCLRSHFVALISMPMMLIDHSVSHSLLVLVNVASVLNSGRFAKIKIRMAFVIRCCYNNNKLFGLVNSFWATNIWSLMGYQVFIGFSSPDKGKLSSPPSGGSSADPVDKWEISVHCLEGQRAAEFLPVLC